jgi:hypothetical protein
MPSLISGGGKSYKHVCRIPLGGNDPLGYGLKKGLKINSCFSEDGNQRFFLFNHLTYA